MKLTSPLKPVLELSGFLDGDGRPCTPEAMMCDRCRDVSAVQQPPAPSVERRHLSANSDDNDDPWGLHKGAKRLQTRVQTQARGLADYRASLGNWRGVCMFCHYFPDSASGQVGGHALKDCRNSKKV